MNSENIKNNDPIQLKQIIIFLKAELTKYEHKVKKYEDSYHYSIIENLEQENAQLTIEKNELSKKLREMQKGKYTLSVNPSLKTKQEWLPVYKQLNEVIKKLNNSATTEHNRYRNHENQISSLQKSLTDFQSTIEQLEYRLVELIQTAKNEVHTQIEKISIANKERHQFERQRFTKEIEGKNKRIEKLQREIVELKEQYRTSKVTTAISKSGSATAPPESFLQLDYQIKILLAKSLDYEKKLDAKLNVINAMEHKLDLLTVEIDNIKVLDTTDENT